VKSTVCVDPLVDARALVPVFDFSFLVVVAFEAFVSAFAVPVLDLAADAFVLVLFAPPFAGLAVGLVVLTFDTAAFGAGLFTAAPFGG
jgi:hypothetical protein